MFNSVFTLKSCLLLWLLPTGCWPGGWRTEHDEEEEEDEADEGEGTEDVEAGGYEVIVDVPEDVEAGGRAGDGDVSGQLE